MPYRTSHAISQEKPRSITWLDCRYKTARQAASGFIVGWSKCYKRNPQERTTIRRAGSGRVTPNLKREAHCHNPLLSAADSLATDSPTLHLDHPQTFFYISSLAAFCSYLLCSRLEGHLSFLHIFQVYRTCARLPRPRCLPCPATAF